MATNTNTPERTKDADQTAHAVRVIASEATKAGEQIARAEADAVSRSTEVAGEALQASLNTASQSFQRMSEQFIKTFSLTGPDARRSSENVQAISEANAILARGLQEAAHEWISLAQNRITQTVEGLNQLSRCRSVHELVAVQGDLVRDGMRRVIEANQRVAELSVRVAGEAARAVRGQTERAGDRVRRPAYN